MDIIDIHTHSPEVSEAVLNCMPGEHAASACSGASQLLSVGLHPWHTADSDALSQLEALEREAADPKVRMIGECGIDLLRGADSATQLEMLRRQVELSERLSKPLLLHVVKGLHLLLNLRSMLPCRPRQPWVWHGFRGNAATAMQFLKACGGNAYISFGPRFNAQAAAAVPEGSILLETDDSGTDLRRQVLPAVAAARGITPEQLETIVLANTRRLLGERS